MRQHWGGVVQQRGNRDADRIPRENADGSGPSRVFVKPLGLLQTGLIFLLLHRNPRRCSCGFPVFLLPGLFLASRRCQGAPSLLAGVLVFPESGAPTGGSSPGQLQMRNTWPSALAAAQIHPFEKITVLLLPPPPVGHARSAEGRGMCRRDEGSAGRAPGRPHLIRPLLEKVSHYFSSPFLPQTFRIFLHGTRRGLFSTKPDRVFRDSVQLRHLSPVFLSLLPIFASWSIDRPDVGLPQALW